MKKEGFPQNWIDFLGEREDEPDALARAYGGVFNGLSCAADNNVQLCKKIYCSFKSYAGQSPMSMFLKKLGL